jgi:hypothetical protein
MRWVGEGYQAAGGFVFGRRTYELFAGHWPTARDDQQAIARPLNSSSSAAASACPRSLSIEEFRDGAARQVFQAEGARSRRSAAL